MLTKLLSINEVNNLISEHFIKIFGNVVEHFPAAAIGILKNRPFSNPKDISQAINNYLDTLKLNGKFTYSSVFCLICFTNFQINYYRKRKDFANPSRYCE